MKIAFIGGGSLQWAPRLTADMALTNTLANAHLVLYDIDAKALDLLTPTCKKIVARVKGSLSVSSTLNRAEALRDAEFVILCVAIGGLRAMRNDLEIPEKYGIYQAVGDTVGPGGLVRGLRHIPFAVQVAREMEELCPNAWLLNLTNPMTTICRAITLATRIRTIGLCHEVTGVSNHLARLFDVPPDSITLNVAGINHLPAILDFTVNGQNGKTMLRSWLVEHDTFQFIDDHISDIRNIFKDRLAVKLSLFEKTGILFGAGDRHVAEFFTGFLTDATNQGADYGVVLTTIAHREDLAAARRGKIEQFVNGEPEEIQMSGEQLAPLMAALIGGPPSQFVVNVPNQGQIDNLPREATVECMAHVDTLDVRPLAVGALPNAAYAAIAPHVARQELIVEAALTGCYGPALAALSTDPLVQNPATVKPMLNELMAANQDYIEPTSTEFIR